MGKTLERIDADLAAWIAAQRIFFVGTAPLAREGRVNLSPKGGDSFRVLGPDEVAYLDYTGSGAETAAHLRENGRIVIMFCSFDGPPRIVRLHGEGSVVSRRHPQFPALSALFQPHPGTRAIIHVRVKRVGSSCGFSVPRYHYVANRTELDAWAVKKVPGQLEAYRNSKNRRSIDGLPAFAEGE